MSGSKDRGSCDSSIQFINFGRVGDKSFREWRQKIGGERVGDNNLLTFCPTVHLRIHKFQFFPFIFVKSRNS